MQSFKRWLSRLACAAIIALVAIGTIGMAIMTWAFLSPAQGEPGNRPSYVARAAMPDGIGSVTLSLHRLPGHFAEHRIVLHFEAPGGSAEFEPLIDTGGHARTSLYTTPENDIVALGTAGRNVIFDGRTGNAGPLERATVLPLTYRGAFDFMRTGMNHQELRFITPDEAPECIATMGDRTGINRPEAHRTSCS